MERETFRWMLARFPGSDPTEQPITSGSPVLPEYYLGCDCLPSPRKYFSAMYRWLALPNRETSRFWVLTSLLA